MEQVDRLWTETSATPQGPLRGYFDQRDLKGLLGKQNEWHAIPCCKNPSMKGSGAKDRLFRLHQRQLEDRKQEQLHFVRKFGFCWT